MAMGAKISSRKKHVVVLSGAGLSAESGIPTFRGGDGLWEGHRIEDVATPEAWERNPRLVLEFYNQRRKRAMEALPNMGHRIIAQWEDEYRVTVITQNVDDLHERAGSSDVLHLHGSLLEARSSANENLVYPLSGWEMKWGEVCAEGSPLRPNIVWFNEDVPKMDPAARLCFRADAFVVVGTSLVVYPAAGLLDFVRPSVPKIVVDPKIPPVGPLLNAEFIEEVASTGLEKARVRLGKLLR
jgi:NAD-dependent deacetylase